MDRTRDASPTATPHPTSGADDRITRAMGILMDREWPGPMPNRHPRVEEAIMSNTSRTPFLKRHLWAGGVLLLLAGTAIGAVATSVITQRFTGYVELEDGTRMAVEGELMIETEGDGTRITINAENLPEGQVTGGVWQTEDGRMIKVRPVSDGAEATLTIPANGATSTDGN